MLCSPALASFADAKLLDFRHSTFYSYIRSCMRGAYDMYVLTIGACASSRAWSEVGALANVTRTSVFNEIHTMLTLKIPYEV